MKHTACRDDVDAAVYECIWEGQSLQCVVNCLQVWRRSESQLTKTKAATLRILRYTIDQRRAGVYAIQTHP